MPDTILCYVDMFALDQTAMLGNEKIKLSTDSLVEDMVNYCYSKDVYKVHLFGNQAYLEKIADSISEYIVFSHLKKMVEIEVN